MIRRPMNQLVKTLFYVALACIGVWVIALALNAQFSLLLTLALALVATLATAAVRRLSMQ